MSNKQPITYLQTDLRWKTIPYAVSGENSTIGSAGCGPTCAAMILSTLLSKEITPIDTCSWSLRHGYKALNQGTYYTYFAAQFAEFGIECRQLNSSRMINQPDNQVHDKALSLLKQGYYLIALMGPGTWTKSGHFIVVWRADNVYHINDPASKKSARMNGNINTFRKECRMYWSIDARQYNIEEDEKMDGKEIFEKLTEYMSSQSTSDYAKEASKKAVEKGLFRDGDGDGFVDNPQGILTREQLATVLRRAGII